MKKMISILLALLLSLSLFSGALASTAPEYIAAPYTAEASEKGPTEYLAPVFYKNEDGPTIGVTLVGVIKDGDKYFKDSNNNQKLDVFEDWRLDTATRVADLLAQMNQKQRIGLLANKLVCNPAANTAKDVYDEKGNVVFDKLISEPIPADAPKPEGDFVAQYTAAMKKSVSVSVVMTDECRSGVIRKDTDLETGALYNNALNMAAEYTSVTKNQPVIPFLIISNPMLAGYPGPMGFAAAAIGDGNYDLIKRFAEADAKVWNAKGIRQMYGPQIDLITDARWARNATTYTEIPEVNAGLATALVTGYQHGTDGAQDGDVALIMKHFPGDGASENGFESHYANGQYRLYPTEGSLEKYQLVGFQAAVDAGVAGIMPAYSRVTKDGRSVKQSYRGTELDMEEIGTIYSDTVINTLLHKLMGFKGFINTDSGIVSEMFWGADQLTVPERYAAVYNNGADVVGDGFFATDYVSITEAVEKGLVTKEAFDRATSSRMTAYMNMNMFENPYRDPAESKGLTEGAGKDIAAVKAEVNQKSIVLLKNKGAALPLKDTGKKVFIATFTAKGPDDKAAEALNKAFTDAGFTVVEKSADADIAFLDVVPGGLATDTKYMGVLDLVDGLKVDERKCTASQEKTGSKIEMTSLADIKKVSKIADEIHAKGGVVIANVKFTSPWILTNLEPFCDGLIAQFGASVASRMDIMTGKANPSGKLPITLPASNEVLAVNEVEIDGVKREVCVSPNDVPGFEKDQYMSKEVLSQSPSGSYAYKDSEGNVYVARFGLNY